MLLCYPIGHEYLRTHRAYRRLGERLAEIGFHVLRFDYSGTGDSAGNLADQTLDHWVADSLLAADELQVIAGTQDVVPIGLRLGGTIALKLCTKTRQARCALWDPVVVGDRLIAELHRAIETNRLPKRDFVSQSGSMFFGGYEWTPALLHSLSELNADDLDFTAVDELLVLCTHQAECAEDGIELSRVLSPRGTLQSVEGPKSWHAIDDVGGGYLPAQPVDVLVQWCDDRL